MIKDYTFRIGVDEPSKFGPEWWDARLALAQWSQYNDEGFTDIQHWFLVRPDLLVATSDNLTAADNIIQALTHVAEDFKEASPYEFGYIYVNTLMYEGNPELFFKHGLIVAELPIPEAIHLAVDEDFRLC